MNSLLRIRIQVSIEKAAEIAKLAKALGTLGSSAKSSTPGVAALGAAAEQAAKKASSAAQAATQAFRSLPGEIARSQAGMKSLDPDALNKRIMAASDKMSRLRVQAAKRMASDVLATERQLVRELENLKTQHQSGAIDMDYRSKIKGIQSRASTGSAPDLKATKMLRDLDNKELGTLKALSAQKQAIADAEQKQKLAAEAAAAKLAERARQESLAAAVGAARDMTKAERDRISSTAKLVANDEKARAASAKKIASEAAIAARDITKAERARIAATAKLVRADERARIAAEKEVTNAAISAARDFTKAEKARIASTAKLVESDSRARIAAERQTLQAIANLKKRFAINDIDAGSYRSGLNSIANGSPSSDRVQLAAATALKALNDQEDAAIKKANSFNTLVNEKVRTMANFGKNVQWTGRQLEYNFTLPIVGAAKSTFALQMASEEALTSLVKVYGDGSDASNELSTRTIVLGQNLQAVNRSAMTPAQQTAYDLGRAFRYLSDGFGVSIDKVGEVGAMWASTGAKGTALAKATRMTLEAMMIGDFSSTEDAFNAIIKVQQGYQLSADQTTEALAVLNTAENITAAQFTDLVEAIGRGASSMKTAGVSLREFAGMVTLLVPSNTAEAAGNGLKTLMSRIMAPTEDAIDAMRELGVTIDSTFWAMNGTERLQLIAKNFAEADDATKQLTSSMVAGRYQLNRFDLLMAGLNDTSSNFYKVMNETKDSVGANSKVMATYRKEIQQYLNSTPQGIKIAKTEISNLASQILVQLTPAILQALAMIRSLVQAFSGLDPEAQKWIIFGVTLLAIAGPALRLMGAVIQLGQVIKWTLLASQYLGKHGFGMLVKYMTGSGGVARAAKTIGKVTVDEMGNIAMAIETKAIPAMGELAAAQNAVWLTNPWVLLGVAIVASIAFIYIWRDEFGRAIAPMVKWAVDAFNWMVSMITKAFSLLPQSVQNALIATVRVIESAVRAAWKALQWLNPFQRHSPSLVDNVTAGVAIIAERYASLRDIGSVYAKAATDLRAFAAATAEIRRQAGNEKRTSTVAKIQETAPDTVPMVNAMYGQMDQLQGAMERVNAEIEKQQQIVNGLDLEYRRLDTALRVAQADFDRLEKAANTIRDQLSAAKEQMQNWANTPIEGSRALSDALFENEMAQKRLRLEMLKMEDAGQGVDQVRNRLALLQGEIETLTALQDDLRSAGAGSEITGQLAGQISGIRAEQATLSVSVIGTSKIEAELEALRRKAEIMDLEGSLKFDPLRRQIEQLIDTSKEATFEEIIAGIKASRTEVDRLTAEYAKAQAAVEAQRPSLEILKTAHDDLGATLDIEKGKLDDLKEAYSDLERLYNDIDQSINDLVSNMDALSGAAGGAASAFDGVAGNWDTFDPNTALGDPTLLKDFVDGLQAEFEQSWGGLKQKFIEKWNQFKNWVGGFITTENLIKYIFTALTGGAGFAIWFVDLETVWENTKTAWSAAWKWLKEAFESFKGAISDTIGAVSNVIEGARDRISAAWDWVIGKLSSGTDRVTGAWNGIKSAVGTAAGAIGTAVAAIGGFFSNLDVNSKKAWDAVVAAVNNAGEFINDVLFNKIPFAIGWLIGEFLYLPVRIVEALGDLGAFIWESIKNGFALLLEEAGKVIGAIWDFFQQLPGRIVSTLGNLGGFVWDHVRDGFGALKREIGDIANNVVDFFEKLPGRARDALGDLGSWLWSGMSSGFDMLKQKVGDITEGVLDFFRKLPERIGDLVGGIRTAAEGVGKAIWEGVKTAFSTTWDVASSLAGSIEGVLKGAYNGMVARLESAVNSAIHGFNASSLGKWLPDIPDMNFSGLYLHTGGIVPGPVGADVPAVLQAGEGVLSLKMMSLLDRATQGNGTQGMGSGSQAKTINFFGDLAFPNITDPTDAEQFIRNLETLAVS